VQHHKWQEAVEATEELQEVLGQHQDAITAIERLAIYAGSLSPTNESTDELLNTARLMQKEFGRVRDRRRDFESAWEEFRESVS
jgi:CHAD domain-containing protein